MIVKISHAAYFELEKDFFRMRSLIMDPDPNMQAILDPSDPDPQQFRYLPKTD